MDDVTLNELPSVTVNGFVIMEGQTMHTGSVVEFIAAGPGGVSDQTTSTSDGSYSLDLFPGLCFYRLTTDRFTETRKLMLIE